MPRRGAAREKPTRGLASNSAFVHSRARGRQDGDCHNGESCAVRFSSVGVPRCDACRGAAMIRCRRSPRRTWRRRRGASDDLGTDFDAGVRPPAAARPALHARPPTPADTTSTPDRSTPADTTPPPPGPLDARRHGLGMCPASCRADGDCNPATPGDPGNYCCISGLCLYMTAPAWPRPRRRPDRWRRRRRRRPSTPATRATPAAPTDLRPRGRTLPDAPARAAAALLASLWLVFLARVCAHTSEPPSSPPLAAIVGARPRASVPEPWPRAPRRAHAPSERVSSSRARVVVAAAITTAWVHHVPMHTGGDGDACIACRAVAAPSFFLNCGCLALALRIVHSAKSSRGVDGGCRCSCRAGLFPALFAAGRLLLAALVTSTFFTVAPRHLACGRCATGNCGAPLCCFRFASFARHPDGFDLCIAVFTGVRFRRGFAVTAVRRASQSAPPSDAHAPPCR